MSAMRRRPAMLIAVLAILGPVVAGCGSEPREANSAIIIQDRVISVDDVQQRLNHALEVEPAAKDLAKNRKLDLVSRGIVDQLVRHELVADAAGREGLTVSEKDLDDAMAQVKPSDDPVQRSIMAAFDQREYIKDRLLIQKYGAKYLDKLDVTFDGASVISQTNAKTAATELAKKIAAAPDKSAEIVQGAASEEINPAIDQSFNPVNTYQIYAQYQGQIVLSPIFSVDAGNVVAFPVASGPEAGTTGWLVAYIKKRVTNATLPEDQAAAVSQVDPAWAGAVGLQMLSPLATQLNVRISPRYGVWDELAVGVAATDAEKIGVVLPAASPPSS